MSISQLFSLEINSEKKSQIILENIIRMLTNRNLLNEDKLDENIKNIIKLHPDDQVYPIKLDNPSIYYPVSDSTKIMYVKLLMQKITGVSKTSVVGEFINQYKLYPKIIVVTSITGYANVIITTEYPFSEIFLEKDLMIDKVRHISVPKHILLSEEEGKKVFDEYFLKKKQIPRIFSDDPQTKYFNAKIGRIFTIIRPSLTSGLAPYHRIVVKGTTNNS